MGQRSTWVGWGLLALGLVGNAAGVVLSVVKTAFSRTRVRTWSSP
jgi:hypothetical protein